MRKCNEHTSDVELGIEEYSPILYSNCSLYTCGLQKLNTGRGGGVNITTGS